ncbi:MAG: hypothetical protein ACREXT_04395, partial [Gammaproteobacteria bacterium]
MNPKSLPPSLGVILAVALAPLISDAQSGEVKSAEPSSFEDLRERLTEREDHRRRREPYRIKIRDRPLTLEGEYEFRLWRVERPALGLNAAHSARSRLDQEIEVESFYGVTPSLSMFAQASIGIAEDLMSGPAEISEQSIERGELWLHAEEIGGSHFDIEFGRLHFEDDRRWWWDQDLDAIRVTYELATIEFAVAVAEELGPDRTDRAHVLPEHDRVRRLLASAGWTWRENHALQLFALRHSDHSTR